MLASPTPAGTVLGEGVGQKPLKSVALGCGPIHSPLSQGTGEVCPLGREDSIVHPLVRPPEWPRPATHSR